MKLSEDQIKGMQQLRKEGASIKELSKQFGVSANTVQYHTRQFAKFSQKTTKDYYSKIRKGER